VNLAQRLQQFAEAGETVLSEPTCRLATTDLATVPLGAQMVKGRDTPVVAFKLSAAPTAAALETQGGAP
jgi:class 3 adenylate cyclase